MSLLLLISRPGSRPALRATFLLLLSFLLITPAPAADLIEPWEPGFSDLELYVAGAAGRSGSAAAAVLGFGLPADLSLGATLATDADGQARVGVVAFWSGSLAAGWDVDVYAEAGRTGGLPDGTDWLAGTEWSFHRHRVVPYLRLTRIVAGDSATRALAGVMVPAGGRVELHLELSSNLNGRARSASVGPNVRLGPGLELLTEVSVLRDPFADGDVWIASVGLVLDPRTLRPARSRG